MKEALAMIEGGWTLTVWPDGEQESYTACFSAFGESPIAGHAKSPRLAIRAALREFDRRAEIQCPS